LGGLGGLLGGVLGGGALSGGLQDLLDRLRQNGHGDKADSWVSTGANRPVAPHELEQALGQDRIDWLTRETGMSREQLLSGLSTALPQTVDKLTPDGRVPSGPEMDNLLTTG
ncbi:MAG: YidB family protein, partial [Rhizomicrobium sp.]